MLRAMGLGTRNEKFDGGVGSGRTGLDTVKDWGGGI